MKHSPLPLRTSYKRVLLKISGEALAGTDSATKNQGIDQDMLLKVANDIRQVHNLGVQICLVVGGGNIYRGVKGVKDHGIDRSTSDYMGMLATVINALALQNAIEQVGIECRVMTAIPMQAIGEMYIRRRAIHHMEKNRVLIFAAGTGNPYFTTDTAAALRALEMNCDLLLKATKVSGIYDSDPLTNPAAVLYKRLRHSTVITNELNIMDTSAVVLVKENNIPIAVFSIYDDNGFANVILNKGNFTLVSDCLDD